MKKLISFLCALSIITVVIGNVYAKTYYIDDIIIGDDEEVIGDFVYMKDTNEIVGYLGTSEECIIPDNTVFNGVGVIHLRYTPITKLVFGKNVRLGAIGNGGNTIEEIVFTEPITAIPNSFARNCSKLKTVSFADDSLESIGNNAFENCTELSGFDFGTNLRTIGDSAFYKTGLQKVEFPDTLVSIGKDAFAHTPLTGGLILPESLRTIGERAFEKCTNLEKIHLPNMLDRYIPNNWFGNSVKEINVPDSVVANPPKESDEIINSKFLAEEITFNGDMNIGLYKLVMDSIWCKEKYLTGKSDKKLNIQNDCVIIGDTVVKYVGDGGDVVVPDGIKVIFKGAFSYQKIDSVILPESLLKIEDSAFKGSSIKKITIPKNVETVGRTAFGSCYLLEELVFEGAPKLGELVTYDCIGLKNGTITFKDDSIGIPVDFYNFRGVEIYDDWIPWSGEKINEEDTQTTPVSEVSPTPKPTEVPDKEETTPIPTTTPMATTEPEQKKELTVKISDDVIKIYANDKQIFFFDVVPFIDSANRTQAPVRAVAEALGCEVDYVDGLVTIRGRKTTINLTIGSDILTKNGENIQMDTAAVIISDRTFIPVRYIAEALGYTVNWENIN